MKYEITQDDISLMEYDMKNNRTLRHISDMSQFKFSVGDVLIRENKYGEAWQPHLADCGLPYKYVYVFENTLGVGYIRRLSINGRKFVDSPICVVNLDPDNTRFTLDPEYSDHILLGAENEEFDAKSRYDEKKRKREAIHRKNKKLMKKFTTEIEALEWANTLKPGDQFWYGYAINRINKEPYTFVRLEKSTGKWIKDAIIATSPKSSREYNFSTSNLTYYYIFTSQPTFIDDQIN